MEPLTYSDLIEFVRDFRSHCKATSTEINDLLELYTLSGNILCHFLGPGWVMENIFGKPMPKDKFFKAVSQEGSKERFQNQDRAIELAEILFNLQFINGMDKRLNELRCGTVESSVAELEGAKLLVKSGLSVQFVNPVGQKGFDYDTELYLPNGTKVCCEMKCKIEGTKLSKATLKETLRKARDQLPKDALGLIFVKIPEEWVKQQICEEVMLNTLQEFFRRTQRVFAVIFHWEEWYFRENTTSTQPIYDLAKAVRVVRFREEVNEKPKLKDLGINKIMERVKFGASFPGIWFYLRTIL
jgi:hypothetical protein